MRVIGGLLHRLAVPLKTILISILIFCIFLILKDSIFFYSVFCCKKTYLWIIVHRHGGVGRGKSHIPRLGHNQRLAAHLVKVVKARRGAVPSELLAQRGSVYKNYKNKV